ncbi:MAG TPA: methylmalonyl Co-A mutase-associated GTPase MeaB [Acidimicrobiales bacterium]|nr:methylmalonyl Co-A mutase-associated GTPase MeaB [Acidimicrobiales bacterium]
MPAPPPSPRDLLSAARAGDRRATGRLLSLVERGGDAARQVAAVTFAPSAEARHVVGVTGAPGAGKSTLTDRYVGVLRARGDRVAVLAVDPSSPFSGGAILGDRVRMQSHFLDEGVFIRSMATRGHLGGLALAAPEAIRVLAAAGYPLVVVVNPGWGDSVQANKAGLLEVADVFVVNKADRDGAEQTRRDLESMLDLGTTAADWRPPVVLTAASSGDGVDALADAVDAHRAHLEGTGALEERRRRRLADELDAVLVRLLERDVRALRDGAAHRDALARVVAHELDPHAAAVALVAELRA